MSDEDFAKIQLNLFKQYTKLYMLDYPGTILLNGKMADRTYTSR